MPSYRVRAFVGLLRPGTAAPDLLPDAVAFARTLVVVEASDVEVVRGRARVTVRYQADDDAHARRAGWAVLHHLDERAEIEGRTLTRRFGARWYPVRPA
ncbi:MULTISPECIES: hypothetical protein [Cellulomonas]|uniref:Uncharacterized protein n=1 Tax=Cellulomonas gilvus (strain ATCC 13127 / NRRL B-14078) TaxID=593907 RepID=F8A5D9_CELGA|nr:MULTISPECIES: hypothetical protein [Cellulomonas]AEI10956.1 hypothetical protein Celgi_0434 [Cellulomonas gilvus ATCC 13127]MCR6688195.1 hypothetical protein [Cellulomonas sp.]